MELPERRDVRRALKKISGSLRKTASTIRTSSQRGASADAAVLNALKAAAEYLVEDVFTAGVLAHLEPSLKDSLEPGWREWNSRKGEGLKPDRLYGLDHLTKPRRMEIANDIGPRVVALMAERIAAAVEAATVGVRGHAGARGNPERNHLIAVLANWWRLHRGHIGAPERTLFMDFCSAVFETMGLSIEGLEKRITRVMDKIQPRN